MAMKIGTGGESIARGLAMQHEEKPRTPKSVVTISYSLECLCTGLKV